MLKWIGTLTSILGSFAVASNYFQIGYILFAIGSIAWLTVAILTKDRALLTLNATFFVANMLGIYNNFF